MTNNKGPILVIGATGQQGRATTEQLLKRGWEVHAFVRNLNAPAAMALQTQGANLIEGDLDDAGSISAAMEGAYGVFMMLTMMTGIHITAEGIAAEQRWGKRVADIAKELGVAHLVYSSLRGAEGNTGVEYYAAKEAIEAHISQLELPATVLRPTFFMDNLNAFNRPVLNETGELVVNLPVRSDIPISLISTQDIGAFAALAFDRPEEFLGRTIPLAGDYLTPPQIAEIIGRHAGLPTHSNEVPLEQVRAFDKHVAQMFTHFNENPDGPLDIPALRTEHPDLMDLNAWLRSVAWKP
ncbi:NmrA/HSCARG family protein [Nocardia sp. NBC_01327]|uniref:NmrA/HSCARG family protein n=1 Tax=Nocardia sp. NBC_01327 TaxID=2903593 RepID=UPI002E133EFF|nr:NmrA/HSCARG family protein [Nocardia sp. NBC_01327]